MKQYRDFEFNLRELAGSMGDFGTLFPLAVGLIVVNGLNLARLFIMMGLVNIATGLVYRLPTPVEPKKVVSVAAIAQHWPASLLGFPNGGQFTGGKAGPGCASVAAGAEDVSDLLACADEPGHRAAALDFDIIGVSPDDHNVCRITVAGMLCG